MVTGDIVEKSSMCGADLSDIEVAGKVRMLMRDQLNHEAVCTMARDRIMFLSQEVARLKGEVDKDGGYAEVILWNDPKHKLPSHHASDKENLVRVLTKEKIDGKLIVREGFFKVDEELFLIENSSGRKSISSYARVKAWAYYPEG